MDPNDFIKCPECNHEACDHYSSEGGCSAWEPDEGYEALVEEMVADGATTIDTDRYSHSCECKLTREQVIEKAVR